ncbi:MAG: hypothetical protein AAFV80_15480, partial [Bacteroidota bacterium]
MVTPKKTILVAPRPEGCYFNADFLIPWANTNFPDGQSFTVKAHFRDFFEVGMQEMDRSTSRLVLEILGPVEASKGTNRFLKQAPRYRFKGLHFTQTAWSLLAPLFSYCQPSAFNALAPDVPTASEFDDHPVSHRPIEDPPLGNLPPTSHLLQIPFDFQIAFKKLTFKTGYVECQKRIKAFNRPVTFRIPNDHLLSEFDHIKSYFAKKLAIKQIRVQGIINEKTRGRGFFYGRSEDIQRINENTIQTIRQIQLRQVIQKPKVIAIDKSVFNPDEYFDQFDPNLGNAIPKDQQQMLENIFQLEGIRNQKQLQYLAGKLHHAKSDLKFT